MWSLGHGGARGSVWLLPHHLRQRGEQALEGDDEDGVRRVIHPRHTANVIAAERNEIRAASDSFLPLPLRRLLLDLQDRRQERADLGEAVTLDVGQRR